MLSKGKEGGSLVFPKSKHSNNARPPSAAVNATEITASQQRRKIHCSLKARFCFKVSKQRKRGVLPRSLKVEPLPCTGEEAARLPSQELQVAPECNRTQLHTVFHKIKRPRPPDFSPQCFQGNLRGSLEAWKPRSHAPIHALLPAHRHSSVVRTLFRARASPSTAYAEASRAAVPGVF